MQNLVGKSCCFQLSSGLKLGCLGYGKLRVGEVEHGFIVEGGFIKLAVS